MPKIIHKTLRQEVMEIIRMKILNGEFQPGERIVEQELAENLGVSRGPIREALRQIEQEGLIQYTSNVGCSVKAISNQDIYEIYLLRASLETLAVKICNGNFSERCLSRMQTIVKKMSDMEDERAFDLAIEYDNAFHRCIIEDVRLERLLKLWSSLDGSNQIIFYEGLKDRRFAVRNQKIIHQEVLDAFLTHDVDTITKVLTSHYMSTIRWRLMNDHSEPIPYNVDLEL